MNKYDLILKKAEKETLILKHPYVGTEHLLLAILKCRSKLVEFLRTQGLTYRRFKSQLIKLIGDTNNDSDYTLYTPMLRCVLNNSLEYAKKNNQEVDEVILFNSIIESKEGIAVRILETMHIDLEKLKYQEIVNYPYGEVLNNKDINEKLIGRDLELASIIQILLRKNKCNPLLVGKAGVGKTALVEELARRINNKEVPKELINAKILRLDLASLVAGTKYRGEFEEKVTKLVNDIKNNKNVILFIDEVHTLVNAGGSEGAIGAGDILKPFLARGEIRLIGATTLSEYHKFIEPDKALARRMTSVILEEPSEKETLNILINIKDIYENYHQVKVSNNILNLIVKLTTKYLPNKANPDKSIELLDSLCSYIKFKNKLQIDEADVYALFNNKYHVKFLENPNNKLLQFLNSKKTLVFEDFNYLKENLEKYYNPNLFININLNDYGNIYTLNNFLGNPNNTNQEYILQKFVDNPFGVLFIKNYNNESYLKDIINKIIKNRVIIDNLGNEINFSNVLIIVDKIDSYMTTIGFIKNENLNTMSSYFIKYNELQPIK